MILSHKFSFVFIKGRKVGGTSVEIALSTICGPNDIVTPISKVDELIRLKAGGEPQNYSKDREAERQYVQELRNADIQRARRVAGPKPVFVNHMSLKNVLANVPEASGYRVIAVDRNPYAKVISYGNWHLSRHEYEKGNALIADGDMLRSFLKQVIQSGEISKVRNIRSYKDESGSMSARVLRYERLNEEFADLMQELGISNVPEIPHAKKGVLSNSIDPRDIFKRDELDRINEIFEDEFRAFGYQML